VLKSYYIDTYYGKKLKMSPTTGGSSNLAWKLGAKSQKELIADAKDAILVTGFLGGNSNGTTGDYSLGIQGFMVRSGQIAEPIAEMNISGNQLELWKRLVAVGNDPYPYSSTQTPTLVFEGVSFAGV
jgi:PmbA protein